MNTIKIYGQIGRDISDQSFINELNNLNGAIILKINSPGGSVFQGYAIYNALKEYKGKITAHIDGLAASMTSVICLAADEVVMAKNAMYMIHNPSSISRGESKDFRRDAGMLDKIKDIIIEAYQNKTGIARDQLAKMMDDETWFNADEAKEIGFVDQIKNDVFIKKVNNEATSPNEVFACYVNLKSINMNNEILKLLNLPETASDEDAIKAIKELLKDKTEETAPTEEEVENILEAAIREKKISADLKDNFKVMLENDFDGVKNLISKMRGVPKISNQLGKKSNKRDNTQDRSKWGLDEYRQYAPNELRRNPSLYKELVDKEYPEQNN